MITYENVISEIHSKLQDFEIEDSFSDNPSVIFSLLANYLHQAIAAQNRKAIWATAQIVNELAQSEDSSVNGLIDEISIGLYDKSTKSYEEFYQVVSPLAKIKFERTLSLWKKQMNTGNKD